MPQKARESGDAISKGELNHLTRTVSSKEAHFQQFRRKAQALEEAEARLSSRMEVRVISKPTISSIFLTRRLATPGY